MLWHLILALILTTVTTISDGRVRSHHHRHKKVSTTIASTSTSPLTSTTQEEEEELETSTLYAENLYNAKNHERKPFKGMLITDSIMFLGTESIIKKYGFKCEKHRFKSKDGYITMAFRIPRGHDKKMKRRGPVLMMHGLFQSGLDWLFVSAERALPFLLADSGYDVWLMNARGTQNSQLHTHLHSDKLPYWKFSFEEIGLYDLPATIDYVLNVTKVPQVRYIGFGLGSTVFYICMSVRRSYNAKISQAVVMASSAILGRTRSLLKFFSYLTDAMLLIPADLWNEGRLFSLNENLEVLLLGMCRNRLTNIFCKQASMVLNGYNNVDFNESTVARIASHRPANTPIRMLTHYMQLTRANRFQRYGYGRVKNLRLYGKPVAPEFDLNKVTAPVYGLCGLRDNVAHYLDCRESLTLLGNCVNLNNFTVIDNGWEHYDFTYSDNVKKLVYNQILSHFADHP